MRKLSKLRVLLPFMLLLALMVALPAACAQEDMPFAGIDFANGNIGFLALYTSPVDASPDATMELVDFDGTKAVKITPDGDAAPYVVIDASSLLGERIADLVTMEALIATEHPSGEFFAVSGEVIAFSGEERLESKSYWSVYLDRKNPNVARVILDSEAKRFVPGAYNFFILNKKDDNGLLVQAGPVTMYLLSITFLDADGNALPVNPDAVFDPPEGFGDKGASSLYAIRNETVIEGASGSSPGGWGQAVSMDTTRGSGIVEPGWFTPGTVITVLYESASAPEIIWQSWSGGPVGWAKVAPRIEEPGAAQFFYEDIVSAFGTDEFDEYFDKFNVGDTGEALTVIRVVYGIGVPPPSSVTDEMIIEGAAGSSPGGWGQAVTMDTTRGSGVVEPGWFAPGTVVTVLYESDTAPELIFQSWSGGPVGWAKVAASALGNGVAQFTYEDIVTAFGSDAFDEFFDKFYVGDTGEALTVFKVTVGKPLPPLLKVTEEFSIEGASGGSAGGWGQAVAMDTTRGSGTVEPEWFVPGTVITVLFESVQPPEIIFQSWSGGPVGWAKVAPYAVGSGIAQFIYEDIVAAFGTDDFISFFDKFYVGDTGEALAVFKVTVGQIQ